ncbi:NAD(P)/FAD-dependent oxidoreductase [Pseudoroseomonas globiformis]|uniref:NAD(P)/FAD-dependent oxidoreductase n=1 Tax=Teichococcus globiformis TaxID=2307229 RepID=A0ABV7G7I2_9PROT
MSPPPLPRSLYAASVDAEAVFPRLEGEHRAPVAIVGGGFTGLSTALHLAEHGLAATLIDAAEPGWGASGRNGGQVNPGLKPDPDQVLADWGMELGARMVALSYGAPDHVFSLIRRHGIVCGAEQAGTLRAAIRRADAAAAEQLVEQCQQRGMPVRYLDGTAIAASSGTSRYAGALLDPRGGHLDPLAYARGMAKAAARIGAKVYGGSPATALKREGRLWRVTTDSGSLLADQVVLATNGYTGDLWPGLRQGIVPVFSAIAATEPLPDRLLRSILPARSAVYETGHVTVYYRVDPGNRLLMGGRGPQRPIGTTAPIQYLLRYAEKLWPGLKGVEWPYGWNGQLAVTADHYPHCHELAPGVLTAMGYNGRGVAMATAMGHELARRLRGAPLEALDMPVTPLKPIRLHRLWRLGVWGKVTEGRIRDRLGL